MKFIKLVLLIRSLLQGTKAFRKGQQHSISCTYLEQNLALKQTNINPIFVLGDVQIMNWSNFDSYNVETGSFGKQCVCVTIFDQY